MNELKNMLVVEVFTPLFNSCFCGSRREFDTGMLLLGSEVNFLHVIPPRQRAFTTLGRCVKECTEQVTSEMDIAVIVIGQLNNFLG